MKLYRRFFLLLLLFTFVLPLGANTGRELQKAQKAFAANDYESAFTIYTRVEQESHHPLAQFTLGFIYKQGLGRPVDLPAACIWFEKSAQKDIPTAATYYAECLEKGIGRKADPTRAAIWYKKAAGLGSFFSYCQLGRLYMSGKGVEKNPATAIELCNQAVEKGAFQAINQLGRWRLEGDESIRDSTKALEWFKKGAELKLPEAEYYIGKMIHSGLINQVANADARYWFERAASQGYSPAYLPTGELYIDAPVEPETGLPSAHNLAKSYLWLSVAKQFATLEKDRIKADALLKYVLELMPESWKPDLDKKIAAHLATFKSP